MLVYIFTKVKDDVDGRTHIPKWKVTEHTCLTQHNKDKDSMVSSQECTNSCCNATTCILREGSQCAEGECCDNCKVSKTDSNMNQ